MGHKTCLHFPRQKKKRKGKKKKNTLTSPVKAEDHCGKSASHGGICCVGGPRCAVPRGSLGDAASWSQSVFQRFLAATGTVRGDGGGRSSSSGSEEQQAGRES